MRAFGDGVLNGSLWTICVELQFYMLTPILYKLFLKSSGKKLATLLIMVVIFLLLNRFLYWNAESRGEFWWKLYKVSFAPWFYMFLTGVIFQIYFVRASRIFSRIPFWPMLFTYLIAAQLMKNQGFATGNSISPVIFMMLIPLVFRAFYFAPKKVNSLLAGNDISYGLYIWHMPIVNQMLYYDYHSTIHHAFFALGISIFVAILSWKVIEKPAMRLKNSTINANLKPDLTHAP